MQFLLPFDRQTSTSTWQLKTQCYIIWLAQRKGMHAGRGHDEFRFSIKTSHAGLSAWRPSLTDYHRVAAFTPR
jgi:hypothetical protein